MARFIVVPQWQGSRSTRAMALIDGADAIAGDLPSSSCHRVEVPYEAGESLETGVRRASTLRRVAAHLAEELEGIAADDHLIVVGGDGGVAVPAIGHVAGDDLAVVWFDAHAPLAAADPAAPIDYERIALRAALGDGPDGLALDRGAIRPANVVLVGARSYDDADETVIADEGIRVLGSDATADALLTTIDELGARRLYVHIDLGVLDPSRITGIADAQPFGLDPAEVVAMIGELRARLPLAGASLVGFAPHSPDEAVDDMGAILRIIGALARDGA